MLEQESPNIAPTPTLSQPGLLVMDVDSTLIDEEVIDELGAAAGIGEQIASITARAMNGELDFREALQARVALLKPNRPHCTCFEHRAPIWAIPTRPRRLSRGRS